MSYTAVRLRKQPQQHTFVHIRTKDRSLTFMTWSHWNGRRALCFGGLSSAGLGQVYGLGCGWWWCAVLKPAWSTAITALVSIVLQQAGVSGMKGLQVAAHKDLAIYLRANLCSFDAWRLGEERKKKLTATTCTIPDHCITRALKYHTLTNITRRHLIKDHNLISLACN